VRISTVWIIQKATNRERKSQRQIMQGGCSGVLAAQYVLHTLSATAHGKILKLRNQLGSATRSFPGRKDPAGVIAHHVSFQHNASTGGV
jgi:hypothetical protein